MCEEYLLAWNDHHASIITAMSELASGIIIISVITIYLDYLLLMIDVRCVLVLKNRIMMMMMKITLKIMITIINIIMILILRIIIIIIIIFIKIINMNDFYSSISLLLLIFNTTYCFLIIK